MSSYNSLLREKGNHRNARERRPPAPSRFAIVREVAGGATLYWAGADAWTRDPLHAATFGSHLFAAASVRLTGFRAANIIAVR